MLQRSHQPLAKKSPSGTSTDGASSSSQYIRKTSRRHHVGCTVSQMCWIAPGPSISASVAVSFGWILMLGETFHPCPSSRAASAPVPSVALPPSPFAPVKFSALIDRVSAFDSRDRLPRCIPSPLNVDIDTPAFLHMASRPQHDYRCFSGSVTLLPDATPLDSRTQSSK